MASSLTVDSPELFGSEHTEMLGRGRAVRRVYGFDEVALVPGAVTVDPALVDLSWSLGGLHRPLPVLASAMDAVVNVESAALLARLGALGVLNLVGVTTRYDDPAAAIARIVEAADADSVSIIQQVYSQPVRDDLVERRVAELRAAGAPVALATPPAYAERCADILGRSGADVFVIQATVTTVRHKSKNYSPLDFRRLRGRLDCPLVIGNCVAYEAALDLMDIGADGLLVGVGPGAACTTRQVLGVGVPQVTAIADCAAAREDFDVRSGRRVKIIADGGIRTGGEVCKAFAAGADAIMIGSPLAAATEAPGRGYQWGMSTPDPALPRGTRIKVKSSASLATILTGPAHRDDGTHNLMGALRLGMATCGAATIQEMQQVEMVIAPALATEGKHFQRSG